jgi:hypothetical protein
LYTEVRCGLAHAYLIETSGNARIDMGIVGLHGIDYDTSKKYIFWVRTYFDEFKAAVNKYMNGIENGTENLLVRSNLSQQSSCDMTHVTY